MKKILDEGSTPQLNFMYEMHVGVQTCQLSSASSASHGNPWPVSDGLEIEV